MKGSLLDLPFAGGIDESTRPELLEPGRGFLALENIRQDAMGGATKRYGFTSLALTRLDATSRSAGYKLFSHREATCVLDASTIDVYSATAARNVSRGRVSTVDISSSPLPTIGLQSSQTYVADVAYTNGYVAVGWSSFVATAGTLTTYAAVIDVSTGAIIKAPEVMLSAIGPVQIGAYGNYFLFVLSRLGGGGGLKAWYLDTTSAATITTGWVSLGSVATDNDGVNMSMADGTDGVFVAYGNNLGGTSRVTVRKLSTLGSVDSATINTSSTTADEVECVLDADGNVLVAWNEGTAVKVMSRDPDSLSVTVATAATVVTSSGNVVALTMAPHTSTAGKGRVAIWDNSTPARIHMGGFQTSAGAIATDGTAQTVMGCGLLARAFSDASSGSCRYYVPVFGGEVAQNNWILADFTADYPSMVPVATAYPSLAYPQHAYTKMKTVAGATGKLTALSVQRTGVTSASDMLRLDMAARVPDVCTHGKSTFIAGGMLREFDGARVAEVGFLYSPRDPILSLGGTGITGTYRYVAVFEEVDANGVWHQSSISDSAATSPAAANQTVTVSVPPLSISARLNQGSTQANSVRIAIYRTLDGGSPPYYRLAAIENTLSSATVSYADSTADATLALNAKLYSPSLPGVNGSAQDRRAPPGLRHLVSYNGMLVGSNGSDLWHSGQDVSGEGTWFNPVFQIPLGTQEDITGLAAQDGTLFVFTRSSIWSVAGEAPADNGSSGGLGTPRRLAADVGCIDARSIVVTSLGIFFQSARGIELLTRAQSVDDTVWQRLQSTTAAFPVCTAATLDSEEGVVYFELAEGESGGAVTGDGRTAVFDLGLKAWVSTDRRTSAAATADAPAQSACMVYTGSAWRYAWLSTDGYVHIEDKTTHLDPGSTWVTVSASTSWVRAAGLQGEQSIDRVMLLAERHTGHDLNFSVYADYVNSSPFTKAFTAAQIAAMTRQWVDVGLSQTTSTAVRVTVTDATPSSGSVGTGKGATWVGLSFPGAAHGGVRRMPAANRGG